MASSSVDFPQPFSPTKNVTGEENSTVSSDFMMGTLNGYALGCDPNLLIETDLSKILSSRFITYTPDSLKSRDSNRAFTPGHSEAMML